MTLDPLLEGLREAPDPVLRLRSDFTAADPPMVALLSGSFDPLTLGHVALAEAALAHADLVLLVYSVRTLPKEESAPAPLLSEEERLAVLEAFCEARPRIEPALCSHGFLAEHVQAASTRFPSSHLALVMGSDKVRQFLDPGWYQDREAALSPLFSRAHVLYAIRSGDEGLVEELLRRAENMIWRDRFERLEVPAGMASLSSRRVRELVAAGEDVSALLPPEAASLVRGHTPVQAANDP
jgi:cytidyltransferase-like protein